VFTTPDGTVATDSGAPSDSGGDAGLDADVGDACAYAKCALRMGAGELHVCAVLTDGTTYCWGQNNLGQVGTGGFDGGFDASTVLSPVRVSGLNDARNASATKFYGTNGFTCVDRKAGAIDCFGDDSAYGLGRPDAGGDTNPHPDPQPVGLATPAHAVVVSHYQACAIDEDGGVVCWGIGYRGDGAGKAVGSTPSYAAIEHATQASLGENHGCAHIDGGTIVCWGENTNGQLGTDAGGNALTPVPVDGVTTARSVTSGGDVSCATLANGHVQCWGNNAYGTLGRHDAGAVDMTATDVELPAGVSAVGVATTSSHACALSSVGTVYCWGTNGSGEVGVGSVDGGVIDTPRVTAPTLVNGLTNVVHVAVAEAVSCAVTANGGAYCWGNNSAGQLGQGTSDSNAHPAPVRVQLP